MIRLLSTVILVFSLAINGYSQSFAIHISSPFGLVNKFGLKAEYRQKNIGYLLFTNVYYGTVFAQPGSQFGAEGRYYFGTRRRVGGENFFYGKALGGVQNYVPSGGGGFFDQQEMLASYYYGVGAGVGRHFNLGAFFMEFNGGVKICVPSQNQGANYFVFGQGAAIDLHFNFGFQTEQ